MPNIRTSSLSIFTFGGLTVTLTSASPAAADPFTTSTDRSPALPRGATFTEWDEAPTFPSPERSTP